MTVTTPLTCDGFANALADYLERDDSPRVRAAVEAHAASCAQCGSLLADLQQLRIDASGLPTLTPSRDLWAGIARRIETPVVALDEVRGGWQAEGAQSARVPAEGRWGGARRWMRPVAAAAALVAVTASVTYFATREALLSDAQIAGKSVDSAALDPHEMVAEALDSARRAVSIGRPTGEDEASERSGDRAPRTPPAAEPQARDRAPRVDRAPTAPRARTSLASNQPAAAPVTAAEIVYGREIARLRRIIDQRRVRLDERGIPLDTATLNTIERNLAVIDQAIRESRAALARDPASVFLNEQLNNALEQKVEVLRAAVLLPTRS